MKYWLQYDSRIRYAVKENSWIARLAAKKLRSDNVAVVIGKTVHLWHTSKDEFVHNNRWVRHEMAHIRQFKQYGFVRFVVLYLIESIRHGYYNNRFEIEARSAEKKEVYLNDQADK